MVAAPSDRGGPLHACNPRVARALAAISDLPNDTAAADTFDTLRQYVVYPHSGFAVDGVHARKCPVHGPDPRRCPHGTKRMRGASAWQVILAAVATVVTFAAAYVLLP